MTLDKDLVLSLQQSDMTVTLISATNFLTLVPCREGRSLVAQIVLNKRGFCIGAQLTARGSRFISLFVFLVIDGPLEGHPVLPSRDGFVVRAIQSTLGPAIGNRPSHPIS